MSARDGGLRPVRPAQVSRVRKALTAFDTDRVFEVFESPTDAVADARRRPPAADRPSVVGARARDVEPAPGAIPRQG